jgi:hypothetical protein
VIAQPALGLAIRQLRIKHEYASTPSALSLTQRPRSSSELLNRRHLDHVAVERLQDPDLAPLDFSFVSAQRLRDTLNVDVDLGQQL